MCGCLCAGGNAAETNVSSTSAQKTRVSSVHESTMLDRSHRYLSLQLDRFAAVIDNQFGGTTDSEERARSFLRLRAGHNWDQEDGNDSELRLRGKVRLPRTQERLNLVFSGDNNEELIETRDINNPAVTDQAKSAVDLQYSDQRGDRFEVDYRLGLRSKLKLRASGRYRYTPLNNGDSRIRLSEEPYWQDGRGFGLKTRAEFDHRLSQRQTIRWSNRFDFGESTDGVDWDSLLSHRRQIDDKRTLSVYIAATGQTRPAYLTTQYEIGMLYRKNIWRRWLFLEFEPAYQWRKDADTRERENAVNIDARIEILLSNE